MQTEKQHRTARINYVMTHYNVSRAEAVEATPASWTSADWWKDCVKAYEAGETFTTAQWRKLTDWQRTQILRTHRALSSDTETRALTSMNPSVC